MDKKQFEEDSIEPNVREIPSREFYRNIDLDFNVAVDSEGFASIGFNFGNAVYLIEEFVQRVISSSEKAFEIKVEKFTNKKIMALTELGRVYVPLFNGMISSYDGRYDYSEYVKVFFDVCESMKLCCGIFDGKSVERNVEHSLRPYIFNQMIEKIRIVCKTKKFKKKLAARKNNSTRNFLSIKKYVNTIFENYSRILVLRIDFGYKKDFVGEVNEYSAHRHREQFLNNMRSNSLFDNLLGYVWRLEYGEEKGHHFHFAFFYDGAKSKKDEYLAFKIGRYWEEQITKGNGLHHNCNMNKANYKKLGIGMIGHDETEKRQHLMLALSYLTKKDQYLRKKVPGRCRVIGKGVMPAPDIKRLGRPRRSAE